MTAWAEWVIVAFDHPSRSKSVLYRQGLTRHELEKAVSDAIEAGANLMSIRKVATPYARRVSE